MKEATYDETEPLLAMVVSTYPEDLDKEGVIRRLSNESGGHLHRGNPSRYELRNRFEAEDIRCFFNRQTHDPNNQWPDGDKLYNLYLQIPKVKLKRSLISRIASILNS